MNKDTTQTPSETTRPGLPLMQLGERSCKFPMGNKDKTVIGGFLFCGVTTSDRSHSYCDKHQGLVWTARHGAV